MIKTFCRLINLNSVAKHSTLERIHRVVNTIRYGLKSKEFCLAVFLDAKQAFDRA